MLLSDDVCLSVTYIRPKSRTERPRKTKIGTEIAHVTRDHFQGQRSRSPGCFTHRGLNAEAGAAVTVWTYRAWESTAMLRCVAYAGQRMSRWGAHTGGEGRGHMVSPCSQLVMSWFHYSSVMPEWIMGSIAFLSVKYADKLNTHYVVNQGNACCCRCNHRRRQHL